jgi:adenylate cyclase
VVGASLALLVRRSRALVAERAEAERARGNLARYFSPKVVDELAGRDEPLGRVRRQVVGVLFADLVGFTTLAEAMEPENLMAMLRDFHGHMEEEVFRHGGCLEKFIGERAAAGLPRLRMGVGLHYGPVVAGDIGSRRNMAFATIGDTTNIASRLQSLTRDLGADLVASSALVAAVEREGADIGLLRGLTPRGAQALRGRDTLFEIWAQ